MKRKRIFAALLAAALLISSFPAALAVSLDTDYHIADCGMFHTLAIGKDGKLYVWGSNQAYQLGIEGLGQAEEPVPLEELSSVLSVAAGYSFSAALKNDGTVYEWGKWDKRTDKTPRQVSGLTGVVDIAAGQTGLLALKSDGTVCQWTYGQPPAEVDGLPRIGQISAGGSHYLALSCSGEVWAWGLNDRGQLGDGTRENRSKPVKVEGLYDVVDVAAGLSHSLAVTFRGAVYAWGSNDKGQLGNDSTEDSPVPVEVKSLTGGVKVSAGDRFSMAIASSKGTLYAWGYGEYGQLGQEESLDSRKPVEVKLPNGASYIASGANHNIVIDKENNLYVWGRNSDYQLGNKKNAKVNQPVRLSFTVPEPAPYPVTTLEGLSDGARDEVARLYEMDLVPPMLWADYSKPITRAEMAHVLVTLYEQIKKKDLPTSKKLKFKDLEGHMLEDDLRKACYLDMMKGTPETTLDPDREIKRQEAAKMLGTFLAKFPTDAPPPGAVSLVMYEDAAQIPEWASRYVFYLYNNDIMEGDSFGRFNPANKLSREELLLAIARLVERYGWEK